MKENYHIGTTLQVNEWIEVLLDKDITNNLNISILQTLYSFEGYKAAASQIGIILGCKGKNTAATLNLEMGRWGKRLVKKYPFPFSIRENGTERKWDLFFDGWQDGKFYIWSLKDELKMALEKIHLTGELQYAEEIPTYEQKFLFEGAKKTITVNSYERNSRARELCIKHHGLNCSICNFNFEEIYGEIGKNFIHVHHLTKVADMKKEYEINPIEDLRPVCPNCHAMLHRKEPPLTIEELRITLNKQ